MQLCVGHPIISLGWLFKQLSNKAEFEFSERNLAIILVWILYILNKFNVMISQKYKKVSYSISSNIIKDIVISVLPVPLVSSMLSIPLYLCYFSIFKIDLWQNVYVQQRILKTSWQVHHFTLIICFFTVNKIFIFRLSRQTKQACIVPQAPGPFISSQWNKTGLVTSCQNRGYDSW